MKEQKEALLDWIGTIIMNGPMGLFKFLKFARGMMDPIGILANLTKEKGIMTVICEGDSISETKIGRELEICLTYPQEEERFWNY